MAKLIAASRRGCDVVLIVDWLGGFNMQSRWVSELRRAGATVVVFNPAVASSASAWGDRPVGPLFFRDHRKILVADEVAFCGSLNISEDAGGKSW